MPAAQIIFFYRKVNIKCDGKCHKAWGINNRPRNQLSIDEDDYEYLADGELPWAPRNPGTSEGGHLKPDNVSLFPNRWCVRECERCQMYDLNDPIPLDKDFTHRIQNKPLTNP